MTKSIAIIVGIAVATLIAGCETAPYASRFSTCDAEAGACYRDCEGYEGEDDYYSCHQYCEAEADRCFAAAYDPYRGSSYAYSYGYGPWYGRYGSWYPDSGYIISFSYLSRYGYRGPRYRPRYHGGRRPYGRGGGRFGPRHPDHPYGARGGGRGQGRGDTDPTVRGGNGPRGGGPRGGGPGSGGPRGGSGGSGSGAQPQSPGVQAPQSQPSQQGPGARARDRNRSRAGGDGPKRNKD